MSIEQQLQSAGLSKSQSRVYKHLLERGLSSPPQIATATGIARTNCYNVLQSLLDMRLVSKHQQGKRLAYMANDPEAMLGRVAEQKIAIEELLPDLRAVYQTHQNKPTIRFFDGFEEVKEIYYLSLSAKEVFGFGATNELARLDKDFYIRWLKQVAKQNIVFHDILSHASGAEAAPVMKELLRGLYEFQLLPKEVENFQTDILIWDNNIALLSLQNPVFGTVITSASLAKTFRILFRTLATYVPR